MAKSNIARRLGAFYGIEDGDEPTNTEVGEQPIADEVSAPVADVAEAAAEVAEEEEALADLTTDADQTEDLQGAVEVATNGGEEAMSAESAAWVRLALHQITGKYGITSDVMPTLEAFGGSSGRRAATRATLEGISDFLKKIWNAIKAQIQKVWAYMKNWYLKVLDAAPRLKKKAEAVSKRSENMTGSPEAKDVSGPLKQLHIAGKAPDGSLLAAKFKLVAEKMGAALGNKTSGGYEKTFEAYEKAINDLAEMDADKVTETEAKSRGAAANSESIASFVMSLEATPVITGISPAGLGPRPAAPILEGPIRNIARTQTDTANDSGGDGNKPLPNAEAEERFGTDTSATRSDELPGGKAVFTLTAVDAKNYVAVVRHTGSKFTDHDKKPKEVDSTGDFKTYNSSNIQAICDSIVEICDHIIDYKKAWEKRDKYTAKLKTSVDKAMNNADKEKAEGEITETMVKNKRAVIRDLVKGLQNCWSKGASYESAMINYGISVSRAALTVCEASIAQYKD